MVELNQLYLMTADLERSRKFYEDGLDLTPERVGDATCSYEMGQCELKLQSDFSAAVLAEYNLDPPGDERGTGAIFVIAVERNLDDLYESLMAQDASSPGTVLTEPQDVPWGDRMFLVRDPEGYVLEIRRRPDGA